MAATFHAQGPGRGTRPPTLWVDVEDLFEYAALNPRPSGIQRLAFELYRALHALDAGAGTVRFCRHHALNLDLTEVPFADVEALFANLTAERRPRGASVTSRQAQAAAPDGGMLRRAALRGTGILPAGIRVPLQQAMRHQVAVLRLLWQATYALWCGVRLRLPGGRRRFAASPAAPAASLPDQVLAVRGAGIAPCPGDVVAVFGSPWNNARYAELLRTLKQRHGIRCVMLAYDLIPIVRPEFCDRSLVRVFRTWVESVLPLMDHVFAISRASARDMDAYTARIGVNLPQPTQAIPIGTGFSGQHDDHGTPGDHLPEPGTYVLFVSTIEARKNHLLMFRVWRRLLEEMEPTQVPTLVFAGRVGWMVADMMQQLVNANYLDGRIQLIENPSDADLAALYRGCLFTVFPSLYEGWGLPVTESLAMGKPCFASDRTSVPEAGGRLARYFDPEDANGAIRAIRPVLEDRAALAAWQEQVRREFRPVPWADSARAVLRYVAESVDAPLAHAAE
jgi:glycosyltransferase involved in cell wall biosynthesis